MTLAFHLFFQGKNRSITALIKWLGEDFKGALLTVLLKKNTPWLKIALSYPLVSINRED